jgi:hypothetical protein
LYTRQAHPESFDPGLRDGGSAGTSKVNGMARSGNSP